MHELTAASGKDHQNANDETLSSASSRAYFWRRTSSGATRISDTTIGNDALQEIKMALRASRGESNPKRFEALSELEKFLGDRC
jgi:hypothetical protein